MFKQLTDDDIRYICHQMMGVDWEPMYEQAVLSVLDQCQSKLEVMYLLGIAYYLSNNRGDPEYPMLRVGEHGNTLGVQIDEPFAGGRYRNGFSSLLVVPQYQSPDRPIHHDFGFFISTDNGGGDWRLYAAVEIEGYGVHKGRGKLDDARYKGLPYTVIRVFEETSNPQDWYRTFDPDIKTGVPGEYCYENEMGEAEAEAEVPPVNVEHACAQWIAFFDDLKIPYEQREPKNRFWLPTENCWFLVEMQYPPKEKQEKARLLAYQSEKNVYVFWRGCRLPQAGMHYEYPDPHIRYVEEELSFRKCSASFYGPRIPFPFQDHIPLEKRSAAERKIIGEWNEKGALEGVEVPLPLVPLFELLEPYDYHVALILEDYYADSCLPPRDGTIRLDGEEEEVSPEQRRNLRGLAQTLNQSSELKRFLAIRPAWRCYFNAGVYLETGWAECPLCEKLNLVDHRCDCSRGL